MRKRVREKEATIKLSPGVIFLYVILVIFCIIVIAPLLIVLSSSLRPMSDMRSPLELFTVFSIESYVNAFKKMNYPRQLWNSITTTGCAVLFIVFFSTMAAYPIARIKSRVSRFLYYFFIAGLVVPSQMVIVPVAQMFGNLNIPSTRFTPVIMFITCSLPFSVFLYAGFMKGIPVEIEEAAYLDGASLWQRFSLVVLPLLKPATVSVVITQGLWIWNDYFYPMIFVSQSAQYSLPVGMIQFLGDRENPAQWNTLFAACVLCALPLIIIFSVLQKQFINGIAAGAIKG